MAGADSMVTLQERLVNLINQLNMPIIETSMVISRWTNRLLKELLKHTQQIPENLRNQWPIEMEPKQSESTFDL